MCCSRSRSSSSPSASPRSSGRRSMNATLAIGVSAIPAFVRIARGETFALREEDYVPAAIANGASDRTIIFRHILPNMTSTLLVQATLTIPAGDHRRGGALVPRPRRPAAGDVVGRDAADGAGPARPGAAARRLPGHRPRVRGRSRSTSSATACATSSTRARPADAAPLLEVTDLSVRFDTDDGTVHAVDRMSFTLAEGEVFGIVGESGCGKSVTCMSLVRLLPETAHVSGQRPLRRRGPARAVAATAAARPRPGDLVSSSRSR